MFLKPFKVKSNTTVKSSDRKKLRNDIQQQLRNFTEEDMSNLIPSKGDFTGMKVSTHSGAHAIIFFQQKTPVFFELEKQFYPTIYTMWKCPNVLPKFTTHPQVLEKLTSGADLMLPGVVTNSWHPKIFGELKKDDVCCVDLLDNTSVVAIGKTALSSDDMFLSGKRGKGVIIIHSYLDQLWAAGEKTILPNLPTEVVSDEMKNLNLVESENIVENQETFVENETRPDDEVIDDTEDTVETELDKMDSLLVKCFLRAWKTTARKVSLPLLLSTFYKSHMMAACPKGLALDVKKSSFKKISKFIRKMQDCGIVQVKELSKGVESIVAVDFSHPDIKGFHVEDEDLGEEVVEEKETTVVYEFPEVTELHVVSADLMPVFSSAKISKGSALPVTEIRQIIKNYVTENRLQNEQIRSLVNMDPILSSCLNTSELTLKWDDLMTRFMLKMKPAYQIKFPNKNPIIKKGKLEPIDLSVAQRAANKKVTLINNLELYGIEPKEFAHSVQIGVAASTSVSPAQNRKEGQEVLVQGNQIKFIAKLLLDEYKVPRRFIKGLELAPKSGKKK